LHMTSPIEILAPAGAWPHLQAAIHAGADAVYFGVEAFNMRSSAPNFKVRELPAVVRRCRAGGVRAYLALNSIIYERELPAIRRILDAARDAGVDAVIAADFAVLEEARARQLEVHVSTQMSISNSVALRALGRHWGVRRIVLARECSLDDIRRIRRALAGASAAGGEGDRGIELEVFAHGAMCVAVSGRCFLSQFQYGKSANRGECLQPCRRMYRIVNTEEDQAFDLGAHHVMSPKDICTLPFLDRLLAAGVASLKIEGRNRSPEYVHVTVAAYRAVTDAILEARPAAERQALVERQLQRLQQVYNRGFAGGFYMGRPLDAWARGDDSCATARKHYCGPVVNYYARPGVAELEIQAHPIACGDTLLIIGPTTGVAEVVVESLQIEHATVAAAGPGRHVAVRVPVKVRRNDRAYVLKPVVRGAP
jgi:U32 family peptidase